MQICTRTWTHICSWVHTHTYTHRSMDRLIIREQILKYIPVEKVKGESFLLILKMKACSLSGQLPESRMRLQHALRRPLSPFSEHGPNTQSLGICWTCPACTRPRVRFPSYFFIYLNLHNPPVVSGMVDISFLSKEECQTAECTGHMFPLAAMIGSEVSTWPGWSSEIWLWCLTETTRKSLSSSSWFCWAVGMDLCNSHLDSSPSKKDSRWTLATHWTGTVKDDDR